MLGGACLFTSSKLPVGFHTQIVYEGINIKKQSVKLLCSNTAVFHSTTVAQCAAPNAEENKTLTQRIMTHANKRSCIIYCV